MQLFTGSLSVVTISSLAYVLTSSVVCVAKTEVNILTYDLVTTRLTFYLALLY